MQRIVDFSAGLAAGANVSDEVRMSDNVVSIQATTVPAGGLIFEASNDGINWVTAKVRPVGDFGAASASSITSAGIFVGMIQTRYWRLRNAGATTANGTIAIGEGWIN